MIRKLFLFRALILQWIDGRLNDEELKFLESRFFTDFFVLSSIVS